MVSSLAKARMTSNIRRATLSSRVGVKSAAENSDFGIKDPCMTDADRRTEEEAARRRDEVVKRMLATPPQPRPSQPKKAKPKV